MAKIGMIRRLLYIVNKFDGRREYIPTEELRQYVADKMDAPDYSLRTMQRDFNGIDQLFGIIIKHKKDAGYYIAGKEDVSVEKCEELLLDFHLLTALNVDSGLRDYVLPEHHRPLGSSNMPVLMEAIRNNYPVTFDYMFVRHGDEIVHKKVHPYFLKESNQRWYLLAMDEGVLKTFGIDRISELQLMEKKKFKRDISIDVQALFRDSFGIWDQADIPVEEVILSYDALDGKFLKSLPLHHSQEVLADTDKEFRIKVRLRITNDFVMELLSRSRSLTVIAPLSLRKRVHEVYKNALKRNN